MNGPDFKQMPRSRQVRLGSYTVPLPASRIARILLGLILIIGGFFAFLPVLGIWMVPLGLVVLSVDFAFVRRWRRKAELRWAKRKSQKAKKKTTI